MQNKCSQSVRKLHGIHCSSQERNTTIAEITFLNYCLGFVKELLIDLCSHFFEAKVCVVAAFPCVEIMLYPPLCCFCIFMPRLSSSRITCHLYLRVDETIHKIFAEQKWPWMGCVACSYRKKGNEKENISTEISMSVGGMLGQVTVWGLNHCWHLSDLINNQCPPLFPLDWPKCLHTNTQTSFTFT